MRKIRNTILSLLLTGVLLVTCHQNTIRTEKTMEKPDKVPADTVINQFTRASFFSITDPLYLDSAKYYLAEYYTDLDYFDGYTYPDSLRYADFRLYFVDAEKLFEIGGLTGYLDLIAPAFEKSGLVLNYSNEKSIEQKNYWKHTIDLNQTEYIAYKGDMEGYDLWDQAFIRFIAMLNDELQKQGSQERFYPIMSGNDGRMVMLTPQQFDLVKKYYPDDNEHPKTKENWMKARGYH